MRMKQIVAVAFVSVGLCGCGMFEIPQEYAEQLRSISAEKIADEERIADLTARLDFAASDTQVEAIQNEIAEIRERLDAQPAKLARVRLLAEAAVEAKKDEVETVSQSIFESVGGAMTVLGIPGGGLAAWGLTTLLGSLLGRKKNNAVVA